MIPSYFKIEILALQDEFVLLGHKGLRHRMTCPIVLAPGWAPWSWLLLSLLLIAWLLLSLLLIAWLLLSLLLIAALTSLLIAALTSLDCCSHFSLDYCSHFSLDYCSHFSLDYCSHFSLDCCSHFSWLLLSLLSWLLLSLLSWLLSLLSWLLLSLLSWLLSLLSWSLLSLISWLLLSLLSWLLLSLISWLLLSLLSWLLLSLLSKLLLTLLSWLLLSLLSWLLLSLLSWLLLSLLSLPNLRSRRSWRSWSLTRQLALTASCLKSSRLLRVAWSRTSVRSLTDLWPRQRCPKTFGLRTFAPSPKRVSSRIRGITDPSALLLSQEKSLSPSSRTGWSTSWRQTTSLTRANTVFVRVGLVLQTSLTFTITCSVSVTVRGPWM